MNNNEFLINELEKRGVLRSAAVRNAFLKTDRKDFVTENEQKNVYEDEALPLFLGQTISQPYTVVFMLELLDVTEGNRILEVGFGSGWQTGLLANMVGETGKVYAFEIVPELCEFGKGNLEKYPDLLSRVELHCQSAEHGLPPKAPFDRIIAAAEVDEVPSAWREELLVGGRMVYPQAGDIVQEIKKDNENFETKRFPGFAFVPFIKNK